MLQPIVRLVLALVLVACVAAEAHAQGVPDVVRLRDGSFFRGTIVERSPSQVILLLPTGETRTWPAAEVESAGPDMPAGPTLQQHAPTAPPGPRMARVRVETDDDDITLQRMTGSASVQVWTGRGVGSATIDAFEPICTAPCDVEIPEGTYQLGAARGSGQAVRAGRPRELRGDMRLHLDYINHEGERIAGWVTFGVGFAGGTAMLMAGLFAFRDSCGYYSGYCGPSTNVPMVIASAVVFTGTLVSFFILTFMGDGVEIEDLQSGVRF